MPSGVAAGAAGLRGRLDAFERRADRPGERGGAVRAGRAGRSLESGEPGPDVAREPLGGGRRAGGLRVRDHLHRPRCGGERGEVSAAEVSGRGARPGAEPHGERPVRARAHRDRAPERPGRRLRERGPRDEAAVAQPHDDRALVGVEAALLLELLREHLEIARGVGAAGPRRRRAPRAQVERGDERAVPRERACELARGEAVASEEEHDPARRAVRREHLGAGEPAGPRGGGGGRGLRCERSGEEERGGDHLATTPFRPRDTSAATWARTNGSRIPPGAARNRGRHSGRNLSLYCRSPWKL